MTDKRRILALSSSRVSDSGYLEKALPAIKEFLGDEPLKIAFIPFAFVNFYENASSLVHSVKHAFVSMAYTIDEVTIENGKEIIANADVIMVSGGNTFKLLHDLYRSGLLKLVQEKVNAGTPYIGWSAGSNITGATICTTNDMPIIEPESFKALAFFPFQINPHYYNIVTPGFNGETRDQRLTEFVNLNPGIPVIGLPEGTALLLEKGVLKLVGEVPGVLITNEDEEMRKFDIAINEDLSQFLVIDNG